MHYDTSYWRIIHVLTCLLACTVSKFWPIIGQIFSSDMGVPQFNALAGGDANIQINFTSPETRRIKRLDKTVENTGHWNMTDGRTDRQISCGYCSGLHCEQCGLAVKCKHGIGVVRIMSVVHFFPQKSWRPFSRLLQKTERQSKTTKLQISPHNKNVLKIDSCSVPGVHLQIFHVNYA